MIDLRVQFLDEGTFAPRSAGVLFSANKIEDIFDDLPRVTIKALQPVNPVVIKGEINFCIVGNFDFDGTTLPPNGATVTQHLKGSEEAGDWRHVYQYVGQSSGLPFRAGLTVHLGNGGWSSTPHKFEKEAILSPGPMKFWEHFGYMTCPTRAWGVQVRTGHMLHGLVNDVIIVKDRDIREIPLGSHPASGGPGVRLSYFWAYTCEDLSLMEKFD